ncbi:MAG: DUF4159 domain-containing protein [Pseudomonadota bacterium]
MLSLGALAFLTPWLLAGLLLLPVLWWLLRAVPPAPRRLAFPGVRLLLGLRDPEKMPDRTPWWLLLLRLAAVAAAILAFAEPVLNPERPTTGDGPLLIVMDGGWASAPDWTLRQARAEAAIEDAARAGRPVALTVLSDGPPDDVLTFRAATDWSGPISGLLPAAWAPDRLGFAAWLAFNAPEIEETLWISDGLDHQVGEAEELGAALGALGPVTVVLPGRPAPGLRPAIFADDALSLTVLRAEDLGEERRTVVAYGPDPTGIERRLGSAEAVFEPGELEAEALIEMPIELRNRVARFEIETVRAAGAVALTDDALRRRKVGLLAGQARQESQRLLSPLHYLRNALEPTAELIEAPLTDMLLAAPDVVILADVGTLALAEAEALGEWVEAGGVLIRFAGPRLAASGAGQTERDPLLPVRLRAGGRSVGGAMSWGAPKQLRPFPEGSPFVGLTLPEDVSVTSQVMAQPDPDLPERVMAALEDGTPLVTGADRGRGRVVLFHVTANAEWSSLPLSGLFVDMLERLAVSARVSALDAGALEGTAWTPELVLDGFGAVIRPDRETAVDGARLATAPPGPDAPPGLYRAGDRSVAINLLTEEATLQAATYPDSAIIDALVQREETTLKPWLIAVALALLAIDILATLALGGRLAGRAAAAALAILFAPLAFAPPAIAQTGAPEDRALYATSETVLAYVETGDARVDRISRAGLRGLSRVLTQRTAIEPIEPVAIDLETDELAFYPLLYWPISEFQDLPSPEANAKLNAFMRSGGMIFFDTRDADLGGSFGGGTPNGRMLRRIAAGLDIPPLDRVPDDHVLTRTFYLLQTFPGRYTSGELWVEAAPDAEEVEGLPFRNLNDGVSPVVIGGNDWAAAWAIDEAGNDLLPIGRSLGGQRQREMARRLGVNLVMYVLTGNYKSDQVHVPALLNRLGQ